MLNTKKHPLLLLPISLLVERTFKHTPDSWFFSENLSNTRHQFLRLVAQLPWPFGCTRTQVGSCLHEVMKVYCVLLCARCALALHRWHAGPKLLVGHVDAVQTLLMLLHHAMSCGVSWCCIFHVKTHGVTKHEAKREGPNGPTFLLKCVLRAKIFWSMKNDVRTSIMTIRRKMLHHA